MCSPEVFLNCIKKNKKLSIQILEGQVSSKSED